nr:reverse transcriptase domain-containing protein [Tanacetum cinerariifolium]
YVYLSTYQPSTVKTYDGTGDPKDHLKTFTIAAKVERLAMPTWCHMFNATLLGYPRLWFDELPSESIDSFKDLRNKFLAHYLQQKRYTRDPMELHHVKQRVGESTEAFMKRYTSESLMFKGSPELMRISGYMHGISHPWLIKRLNDNIPKTVDEMMSVTKAFIQREKAAANQSKRKGQPWEQPDFQKSHPEQGFERKEFRQRPRDKGVTGLRPYKDPQRDTCHGDRKRNFH